MKKSKLLALLLVAMALAGTTITFAASSGSTTVGVTSASSSAANVTVDSADGSPSEGKYSNHNVTLDPVIGSPDSVKHSGDLYLINTTSQLDLRTTLYLDNPAALSDSYSYLNLNVTVYKTTNNGSSWTQVNSSTLSLTNGYVVFNLEHDSSVDQYAVSVSGGSFYADSTEHLDPKFYLEVRS